MPRDMSFEDFHNKILEITDNKPSISIKKRSGKLTFSIEACEVCEVNKTTEANMSSASAPRHALGAIRSPKAKGGSAAYNYIWIKNASKEMEIKFPENVFTARKGHKIITANFDLEIPTPDDTIGKINILTFYNIHTNNCYKIITCKDMNYMISQEKFQSIDEFMKNISAETENTSQINSQKFDLNYSIYSIFTNTIKSLQAIFLEQIKRRKNAKWNRNISIVIATITWMTIIIIILNNL